MNLLKQLYQVAQEKPQKDALVYKDSIITYKDLWNKSLSLAAGLRNLGFNDGERIFVVLPNSPEFIISYYGIMASGNIIVPVNPIYTSKELGLLLADADPAAVITNADIVPTIHKGLSAYELPARPCIVIRSEEESDNIYSFDQMLKTAPLTDVDLEQSPDRVIEFLYTSGTTGEPKGAMLTHNNLYSNTKTFAQETEMTEKDRALLVAPAYHAAAQTCTMNNALFSGGTLVIHDGWKGTEPVLKSFQDDKITFFFGPPTMYTFIVNDPTLKEYDVSSLRLAFTGAASLPAEVFNRFKDIFGFEIMEGYGLSETSPVVTTNPYRGVKKIGSIGRRIPEVDVKIFNENDEEVPRGEIGEIVVKGPNVMKGYYNKEKETAEAMRGGWFHTGDMAYMDDDGYVFIVDRKKDLVIRGGMNIYPREVEEVIYTFPGVLETAVIGIKDEVMGEELKAYIVPKEGKELELDLIKDHCRENLAKYKVPRYIELVDSLPKTTTGKILKRELRGD